MAKNLIDPSRWLDLVIGMCFGVLVAAMALWGAVQLVASIWLPLCVGAGVAVLVAIVIATIVHRLRRW